MLNLEIIRAYCLQKPFVTEDMPFGEDTLAFRVMGKIFLLTGLSFPGLQANLKCSPDYAVDLRERYRDVIPGFHMNKQHWNTVTGNGDVPDSLFLQLVDHSYEEVISGLPKRLQEQIRVKEHL
jgi:predicted DNA-binding protein (MmcQ/YjbR family)